MDQIHETNHLEQGVRMYPRSDVDFVCGMTVKHASPHRFDYEGTTYLFCSAGCQRKFSANPDRYLSPSDVNPDVLANKQPHHSADSTEYTCPMHPEIVRSEPDSCPICGMALEPRTISSGAQKNPELVDMTRRFWVSVALTLPLFVLAMGEFLPGRPFDRILSHTTLGWLKLALASPVVLWGGWPFFEKFWLSLRNRSLNMFTLIGLGVAVTYIFSLLAVIAPTIFPESFRMESEAVADYFEAAAVIVTLVLLGQVMELRARSQTTDRRERYESDI